MGTMTVQVRRVYGQARRTAASWMFERRYGIRTNGKIDLAVYGLADENRCYYIASNWRNLRRALRDYEIRNGDVFADLGSGMGRMVLEAARFPFGRVIGVEIAADLHNIAQENVRSYRGHVRCQNIELVHADVLEYDIPSDVTFVYLFSPFEGPVFGSVVNKLVASVDAWPRRLRLIYANPVEEHQLLATGRFRKLSEITIGRGAPTLSRTVRTYEITANVAAGGIAGGVPRWVR